ncbi:hypothetical protein IP91_02237 [Pseudoduganella lurida]|uniref:Cobalt-zinc-cadmium resistance protein n=1 Tax=Pseudoduganella lurida TaxID=1036180 RepID=A0A562RBY7_9BURK|nr:hypothetical protein [Pseudoduganella lurida]TWI66423.1 hypothetical protein IP91_02237 [Pseudoduganella lurida]
MKRLFLILLLALLPLQYAWAAAAAYCDHEAGKRSHFGHHSHQQHGGGQVDNHDHPDKKHQPAKVHADCAACQFGHQAWLGIEWFAPLPATRAAWPPQDTLHFTSHIAEGRQRPDWRAPA